MSAASPFYFSLSHTNKSHLIVFHPKVPRSIVCSVMKRPSLYLEYSAASLKRQHVKGRSGGSLRHRWFSPRGAGLMSERYLCGGSDVGATPCKRRRVGQITPEGFPGLPLKSDTGLWFLCASRCGGIVSTRTLCSKCSGLLKCEAKLSICMNIWQFNVFSALQMS